ncbi:4Fe-4S binding protein [Methanoculleus receptaculi]|uniref:4Fe-4S binding protein n=1 Tax=Methanoculleus receptaculi TaxID=394967 RepID=A0AAX4FU75_9EURY|nr:4Fe-4S binding protein [Methanoculleus receptaculi]WOX57491.1 4Fe-4S binding protein [Methanoculleus receptaculi]
MALRVGCAAPPGKALDNKTGTWRVFKPVFDPETCNGCGICAQFCPEGCIRETDEGKFEPDLDYCKGCGICEEVCPKKSIRMEKEEK